MEGKNSHGRSAYMLVLLSYLTLSVVSGDSSVLSEEKRLTKHLLANYERVGKDGRPVDNSSDPLEVKINFGMIELRKFDIINQELVMVGWTALEWLDNVLVWNSEDFAGVDEISIDSDLIWKPDVLLSNSLSKPEALHDPYLHVTHEGKVTWVNSFKYHFFCKIPTTHLEWDNFQCNLKFVSWSLGSDKLLLKNKRDRFDANYYVTNREWEFFQNKASRRDVTMPWGNGRRASEALYEFTLKRREPEEEEDDLNSAVTSTSLVSALVVSVVVSSINSVRY